MASVKNQALADIVFAERPVDALRAFFSAVDSGSLFASNDPAALRAVREKVSFALERLLVWERPELEAGEGLAWPYEGFRSRYDVFLSHAESREASPGLSHFTRMQARLFLALLPFPMQWRRLLELETRFPDEPEVRDFLLREKRNIDNKLADKGEKKYKLRHFCQVLKSYESPASKGVLRIFSLPYLFIGRDLLARISSRYILYIEPPMGIVFRHAWHRHFTAMPDPPLFGLGGEEDRAFVSAQFNAETTPLCHGDYLEDFPDKVAPIAPKRFDVVFNASFDDAPRKRHETMLDLLQHPRLSGATALFLGRGSESNVASFRRRVHESGLSNRITSLVNLPRLEIPQLLAQCRMGVHLSLYENGCRAIYEFFRSGLPCVISSSMAGMNLDLFNPLTGMAVPDRELPSAISSVLSNTSAFQPRRWFTMQSGSFHSTRGLCEVLEALFQRHGYVMDRDIAHLGSSGASRYANPDDIDSFHLDFKWLLSCLAPLSHYGPEIEFSLD